MSEQTDTTTEGDPFAETTTDPFADEPTAEAPPAEPPPPEQPDEPTIEPPAPEPVPEPTPPAPPAPEPTPEPAPPPPVVDPVPADIPQVDREGQPVSGPLPTTEEDATAAAPQEPPVAPTESPVEAVEAPPQPETPATITEIPMEPQQASPAPPAPAPSSDPAAESNSDGPKSIRHYKLLYQTGPTSFEVAGLTDGNGAPKENYVKLIDGEHYLEARNNEHAYKLAFHLVGSPREGVTLWPVPKASFRPRKVAPAPPAPERERLTIT